MWASCIRSICLSVLHTMGWSFDWASLCIRFMGKSATRASPHTVARWKAGQFSTFINYLALPSTLPLPDCQGKKCPLHTARPILRCLLSLVCCIVQNEQGGGIMPPHKDQNLWATHQLWYSYANLTTRLVRSRMPRTMVRILCMLHSLGGSWIWGEGCLSFRSVFIGYSLDTAEIVKY